MAKSTAPKRKAEKRAKVPNSEPKNAAPEEDSHTYEIDWLNVTSSEYYLESDYK